DAVLMAVGRTPNVTGIENLPVEKDGKFIKVNHHMETSIPGIYAVGDVIGGYQLAHAATAEGMIAVDHICGRENKKEPIIPRGVYTFPEIASVGMTEEEAKKAGFRIKVKTANIAANGKAIATNENNGF